MEYSTIGGVILSLKHGLLGILNYTSMAGYELDRAFKDSLNFFWSANTSQVYRELNAMEKKGWLISEWIIQKEKPNKRVYSITEEGKKELKSWLAMEENDFGGLTCVQSSFLMRIFFSAEIGKDHALEMVKSFKQECLERIEYMNVAYDAINSYSSIVSNEYTIECWRLTALFGEEYFNSCLNWCNKAIEILEKKE